MSDEMTEQELAIVSAIAAEVNEILAEDVFEAHEIVEDRIDFLVKAKLIEVENVADMARAILHLALDKLVDLWELNCCEESAK